MRSTALLWPSFRKSRHDWRALSNSFSDQPPQGNSAPKLTSPKHRSARMRAGSTDSPTRKSGSISMCHRPKRVYPSPNSTSLSTIFWLIVSELPNLDRPAQSKRKARAAVHLSAYRIKVPESLRRILNGSLIVLPAATQGGPERTADLESAWLFVSASWKLAAGRFGSSRTSPTDAFSMSKSHLPAKFAERE